LETIYGAVSPYRIISKVGGGGMGAVYKAEDTPLHPFIAVKFLPEDVGHDPQALSPFWREAEAASLASSDSVTAKTEGARLGRSSRSSSF
jgi:serine/threonine protein kinase